MNECILVVDDDPEIVGAIAIVLEKEGYSVRRAYNGLEAVDQCLDPAVKLILIDVMMPKLDGFSLLQKIRRQGMDVPVLMLTARDAVSDRVKGLDYGADDYLVKPFDFDELTARIRAMTRRQAGSRSNQLSIADLTIDIRKKTASRGGVEIPLLPKEFSILEYMICNRGAVLSREQLENQIWNYEYTGNSNNIDVYISRLRKKIDSGHPVKLLHTIRGVGWTLREEAAGSSL